MSTRGTTKFYQETDYLCNLYHQHDSYPGGLGLELAKFLNDEEGNGFDCLVAQYIAKNKTGPGGLYLTPKHDSQEFNYEVRYFPSQDMYKIYLTNEDGKELFAGDEKEFLKYCEEERAKW